MRFLLARVASVKRVRARSPSTSSFSFLGDRVRSGGMYRQVEAEGKEGRCREQGMVRYALFRGIRKTYAREGHDGAGGLYKITVASPEGY